MLNHNGHKIPNKIVIMACRSFVDKDFILIEKRKIESLKEKKCSEFLKNITSYIAPTHQVSASVSSGMYTQSSFSGSGEGMTKVHSYSVNDEKNMLFVKILLNYLPLELLCIKIKMYIEKHVHLLYRGLTKNVFVIVIISIF